MLISRTTFYSLAQALANMGHILFSNSTFPLLFILSLFPFVSSFPKGQFDNYYDRSCPYLPIIVTNGVRAAFINDNRIPASLLRLHFHDCFVNVTIYSQIYYFFLALSSKPISEVFKITYKISFF